MRLKQVSALVIASVLTIGTGHLSLAAPVPKSYQPTQTFENRCSSEKGLTGFALKIQNYLAPVHSCVSAMRVPNSPVSSSSPKSALTTPTNFNSLEICKLQQPENLYWYRGFNKSNNAIFDKKRHPGPGSVIQVVGISAEDAPAGKTSPGVDYKYYLDFMKTWSKSIDNTGQGFTIRVSEKWYDYGKKLGPLDIRHENFGTNHKSFGQEIVDLVDDAIDFSDVDYVLAVVPAGTSPKIIWQAGLGWPKSDEGQILNMSVAPPATLNKKFYPKSMNGFAPLMWIHELYHTGFDMGDQFGDGNNKYKSAAMGGWGMFATGTTDMLQWQKWLLGFTTDSQVICAKPDTESVNWLAPGSTKTSRQKLLVVPLTESKAIVVESVRATGANYKLTRAEQGALVYVVDLNDRRPDFGYELQIPRFRVSKTWQADDRPINGVRRYPLDTAPLKIGESVTVEGVKITNVEWGAFGDVIKVEKTK